MSDYNRKSAAPNCEITDKRDKGNSESGGAGPTVIDVIRSLQGEACGRGERDRTGEFAHFRHAVSANDDFFIKGIEECEGQGQKRKVAEYLAGADVSRIRSVRV